MDLTIELVGGNPTEALERMFRRIQRPGRGEITKVAGAIRQGFAANFTSESSAEGAWKPLAAATVAERIAQGYGGEHPILRRTGGLRASFVQPGPDHVERFIGQPEGWVLEVGSQHENAAFHERGTRRMPARPVTPLSPRAEDRIRATVGYVLDQIEKATLR